MKSLVAYVTAGVTADWTEHLLACQEGGADLIEVGLPFSDPMLDGVTVQQASDQALSRGTTMASLFHDLDLVRDRVRVPLIAFTYANLVFRRGAAEFCNSLARHGFAGLIVPDLPLDESYPTSTAAAAAGIDLVLLAAPVTPDDRLAAIAAQSRRFVYAISRMGTTGERASLASTAGDLGRRIKAVSSLPVYVGFGISDPQQAAEAARPVDGVVVGSALMRRVLDGATPRELRHEVAALRAALDRADQEVSAVRATYAEIPGHCR